MDKLSILTSADNVSVFALGESAIVLEYANVDALSKQEKLALQQQLLAFANCCRSINNNLNDAGFINAIPGNLNVTLRFNPLETTAERIETRAFTLWHELAESYTPQSNGPAVITLAVHYGGKYGPDIETVANIHQISVNDVVQLHSQATYTVLFNGFLPGFPYLAGLPELLHTQRRSTPRLRVDIGSIAIGGSQTGIYPCQSPGGWQIIGRLAGDSPELFDPHKPAVLLAAGSTVKFEPV